MYIYPLIFFLLSVLLFIDFCRVRQRNFVLSAIAVCMVLFIVTFFVLAIARLMLMQLSRREGVK